MWEHWVELAETSVRNIKQIQFQTKSDTKLDKKDALFVEFSYLLKMSDVCVVKQY